MNFDLGISTCFYDGLDALNFQYNIVLLQQNSTDIKGKWHLIPDSRRLLQWFLCIQPPSGTRHTATYIHCCHWDIFAFWLWYMYLNPRHARYKVFKHLKSLNKPNSSFVLTDQPARRSLSCSHCLTSLYQLRRFCSSSSCSMLSGRFESLHGQPVLDLFIWLIVIGNQAQLCWRRQMHRYNDNSANVMAMVVTAKGLQWCKISSTSTCTVFCN